jgi:hypothetical protein
MGRIIIAAIFLLAGAFSLFGLPLSFALATFKNDDYFILFLNIMISISLLYFGIKIGKFKSTRPLGLTIFLPGIINIIAGVVQIFSDNTAFNSMKPDILMFYKYYSKWQLVGGIIIFVIGFLFFIIKGAIKTTNLQKDQELISSDKDLNFQESSTFVPTNDQQTIIKMYNELKQKYGRNWSEKGILLKIQEDLSFDQELIKNTINSFKKQQEV